MPLKTVNQNVKGEVNLSAGYSCGTYTHIIHFVTKRHWLKPSIIVLPFFWAKECSKGRFYSKHIIYVYMQEVSLYVGDIT